MAKDLLLEIGTEEIPARFIPHTLVQMEELGKKLMAEERIAHGGMRALATPRRLVLHVVNVAEETESEEKESKGPAIAIAFDAEGKPTKAAEGFARGQGVTAADLTVLDGYVWAKVKREGRSVQSVLPELLVTLIEKLNFPKTMRWGDKDIRFARPVHWLIGLFGDEEVSFSFADITSGRTTRGHRFLGKPEFTVKNPEDYFARLQENYVILDQEQRRQIIVQQVEDAAKAEGGKVAWDKDLLTEVVFLVEYPTALCGAFEEDYLDLPAQAVMTPMKEHQRYFPVLAEDGSKLLPRFIAVRNGNADHLELVKKGNERVLRARLADARFFYLEDQKTKLEDRVDKLATIVFQDGLGTLRDKVTRLEGLTRWLGSDGSTEEQTVAQRIAYLSKADLLTGMVTEFTELQGIMGEVYARLEGEKETISHGIFEHYLPRFAGDELPKSTAGRWVSLADKMDNLVGTFSRGLIPTGSQDPYALRRQALGILLMIIDGKMHISLAEFAQAALSEYSIEDDEKQMEIQDALQNFFRIRLRSFLGDQEFPPALAEAALGESIDDLYGTYQKALALKIAWENGTIGPVVQSMIRIGNLLKNAETIDLIDESLLLEEAEKDLWTEWQPIRKTIIESLENHSYEAALIALGKLAKPTEHFFTDVMVMAEDLKVRENRLAMLQDILSVGNLLVDFSKLNQLV